MYIVGRINNSVKLGIMFNYLTFNNANNNSASRVYAILKVYFFPLIFLSIYADIIFGWKEPLWLRSYKKNRNRCHFKLIQFDTVKILQCV